MGQGVFALKDGGRARTPLRIMVVHFALQMLLKHFLQDFNSLRVKSI